MTKKSYSNIYTKLILVVILVIAGILRFYRLDTLPPSLNWDEVVTGYDAYSILKTGRDQFGNFLPLTFRSLDDYKPPLYTYLTSLSIAFLGWNDFAVRFPSAILGVLTVLVVYFLVQEFSERFRFHISRFTLALLTSLLLAISPWHVHFSRLALETNGTIFFVTLGVWAFLKGLKNGRWLVISAFSFGLALYVYHAARVFVPIFVAVLFLVYCQHLVRQKIYVLISGVILSIFLLRLVPIMTSIEGQMRFRGTSLFTDTTSLETAHGLSMYNQWKEFDATQKPGWSGRLFHHGWIFYSHQVLKNYIAHFDPTFLVFTADSPRTHASQMGLIYLIDMPLLFLGFLGLFKFSDRKTLLIAGTWILIAPLASAFTKDVPSSFRSALLLPMLQLLIAAGIVKLWQLFNQKTLIIVFLYCFSLSFFLHQYFLHFASETSAYWQYGRKEAAQFTKNIKTEYDRVVVSTTLEQPHIFFLYYLRYDPANYLQEGGTVSGGWGEQTNHFDKYIFKLIDHSWVKDGRTLLVARPEDFPDGTVPLHKINYLNGTEAIWSVKG